MRFACLDLARAVIAILFAVSGSLWTFLGLHVGRVHPETYALFGWTAMTCTMALVATVIAVIVRDSLRGSVLEAITTRPDAAPAPLHLVKTEDAG